MWIRKYNKQNELALSVQLDETGGTKSLYSVEKDTFLRFNRWGKRNIVEYKVSDEEIELVENREGAKFFRCISKNNKKGGINYPGYHKHFSIENGDVINFNIDKSKLKSWKAKATKKSRIAKT